MKPLRDYAERKAAEGVLDWLFEFVRPDDIVYAIENDEDLVSMLVRCLLTAFKNPIMDVLEVETLFEQLRRRRPDLASVIISMPEGVAWFRRSIDKLRKVIES